MKLDFVVEENGMAYTIVNESVKGTLNAADTSVLLMHYNQMKVNSVYLETGSYLGCSGIMAGLTAKHGTLVYCHDIWVKDMQELSEDGIPPPTVTDYFYEFYKNVKKNRLEHVVIPIRGDSSYTVGIHGDKTIDLAFIDGDHSYDGVMKDLEAVLPKMKPDGIILCHDCREGSEVARGIYDFAKAHDIDSIEGFKNSSIVRIIPK